MVISADQSVSLASDVVTGASGAQPQPDDTPGAEAKRTATVKPDAPRRLNIAITGATGVVYGVRLLTVLRDMPAIETHLLMSEAAVLTLHQELDLDRKAVACLADVTHAVRDVGASIASGSFASDGMIVAPCSMKTLAAIAHGLSDNLITRAADVVLKERRRLILMVRETPLNLAHLRNMTAVTEMGGIIFPPLPGFYQRPQSIAQMVDHTIGRVLDLVNVRHDLTPVWQGMRHDMNRMPGKIKSTALPSKVSARTQPI